jgi:plastocyanin
MDRRVLTRSFGVWLLLLGAFASAVAQAEGREVVALVGAGRDTVTLNAFFPTVLRVQVGDSVTWRNNTDEIHTVSFVAGVPADQITFGTLGPKGPMVNPNAAFPTRAPGAPAETYGGTGLVSSGIMSDEPAGPGAPPNDAFTVTFDRPGTYAYFCLVHEEFMMGTVTVEPAGSEGIPTPEEVLAQAQAEIEPLLASLEMVRGAASEVRREPGPSDTEFVFVKAGVMDLFTPDPRAELLEFLPNDVTVRSGDTVVWGSASFHTITFSPLPPSPAFIVPEPQEAGPPHLYLNLVALMPAKPAAVYDPLQYFNSGDTGFFSMNGTSWALTFEEPGVYEYACLVHEAQGMRGTVTVVGR